MQPHRVLPPSHTHSYILWQVVPRTMQGAHCARIRVANDTRAWETGKVLFFDDSWEHEVGRVCLAVCVAMCVWLCVCDRVCVWLCLDDRVHAMPTPFVWLRFAFVTGVE